jgi:hypothetical protein
VTAAQIDESETLSQAEGVVEQLEAEAVPFARSFVARAVELAEDVWAEAESLRSEGRRGG